MIALGTPGGSGSTTNEQMTEAIDWAAANAGQGEWANIDASQIAAAGMSCGGTQAYAQNQDSRVTAFGIFNSGTLDPAQTDATLGAINVPIFFFLGGASDIAYENVRYENFSTIELICLHLSRACAITLPSTPASRRGLVTSMLGMAVPIWTPMAANLVLRVSLSSDGYSVVRQKRRASSWRAELKLTGG